MKTTHAWSYALLLFVAAILYHSPVRATWCELPDSEAPLVAVNPKPFVVPPPETCLLTEEDLTGYITKASRTADITVSGVVVGTLYDRVLCLGTGSTCDATDTYVLATRVRMNATPVNFPDRNPNCPLWSGTNNECFEINNAFRDILGAIDAPVAAASGYVMGTDSATVDDPDTALAFKYLEYTGKTYKGLNQITPPGTAADRDDSKVMFWADTNIFDPDGVNSPWSPWLYVRQVCPFGGADDHFTLAPFAIKFWQGGEEAQIPTNVQAFAYACKTS